MPSFGHIILLKKQALNRKLVFFLLFTDKRKGMLKNTSTNKCLMPDGSNSSANVLLADCDVNDQRLLWTFDYDEKSKDSILKL